MAQLGQLLSYTNGTLTVDTKALTLSATKTYDGTSSLTDAVTLGGYVGSETLTYTGATANDAHVATAGKYISAITLANGANGGVTGNYALPALNNANAPVTITAKALTSTAVIGGTLTKTYSGTTAATGATLSGSVDGAVAGDTLTLDTSAVTLAYNTAHVVDASKIEASGAAGFTIGASTANSVASDYSFAGPTIAAATASITPATLTASLSNTGITKTYDGNPNTPTGFAPTWSLGGLVSGDTTATLASTGAAYDSKDVVSATKVTVSGLSISSITGNKSSAATDYVLDATSKDVAATITAKALTLSATKTYDGTSSLTDAVTLGGYVGSETLTYTGAAASDAHVATAGKYISAITLAAGANGGVSSNYALPTLNNANAPVTISAATLTPTVTNTGVTLSLIHI